MHYTSLQYFPINYLIPATNQLSNKHCTCFSHWYTSTKQLSYVHDWSISAVFPSLQISFVYPPLHRYGFMKTDRTISFDWWQRENHLQLMLIMRGAKAQTRGCHCAWMKYQWNVLLYCVSSPSIIISVISSAPNNNPHAISSRIGWTVTLQF